MSNLEDLQEFLIETLPKSARKKIFEILEYVDGLDFGADIGEVTIHGARVPVDRVQIHGLSIGVDANGNAVSVEFPYGASVECYR